MKTKTIKAAEIKKGDIFVNTSFGGELVVSGVMQSLTGRNEIHISFEIGGGTTYPNNATITIVDMDAIHAEALEMNVTANVMNDLAAAPFIGELAEAAHAEALQINAAIDLMIDERDHVANCSYEDDVMLTRLANIGRGTVNQLEQVLGESFKDIRHKAMILWANGYVTYPPDECGAEYAQCCIECRQQWVWGAA